MIIVIHKVSQTGGIEDNTGDKNEKSGGKQITLKKQVTKLVVSSKLVIREFHPQFALATPLMLFIFFIVSRLVNIRSCKSSELIPSFMKWYTILLTLQVLSKLGMKQQLENQARAQRKDNSIYTKQINCPCPCNDFLHG